MPRYSRIIALALLLFAAAGAGVFGVRLWRAKAMVRREQIALEQARSLIKDGKPGQALAISEPFLRKQASPAWSRVELDALVGLQDLPRLAVLFDRTPARILESEEASILVARAFLHARKPSELARVRTAWRGREQRPESWLALDSDAFVIARKPREAEKLLRSRELPGDADATRLVRLALVTATNDIAGAWNLLAKAAALQPRNPDIRSFRAQILEATGKAELARVEYVAALVAAPQNPLLRDQLADFYQRSRSYDLALDTWVEALSLPTLDFIWLKAEFWSRVLRPVDFSRLGQPPAGDLDPLARQIGALKPGQFFDTAAFDQLSRARRYAAQRQEVFWLRVLEALRTRLETQASELLRFEPAYLRSWDPDLAAALCRIVSWRQKQKLNPPGLTFTSTLPQTNRHFLFVTLDAAAREEQESGHPAVLAPEIASLLRGPNAFSAALLAAGWREAAIQLRPEPHKADGDPEWLSSAFGQALRLNRSPRAALEFLGTGTLPPATALLRAEILVEEGRRKEAVEYLNSLARLSSPVGFRAAYLLALNAAENHQLDEARQCVARQPLLARDDMGKELLASLALTEGKTNEAEQIYRGIVATSIPAKTWFARQAFSQRRWSDARKLTNELLELMPDSVQLRENILAIDEAEGRP